MRLSRIALLLACVAVPVAADRAQACGQDLASPLVQVIRADMVLVGRVTGFEDRAVTLRCAPEAAPAEARVALVRVVRPLKGADGVALVRVALLPFQMLKEGDEARFFLSANAAAQVLVPVEAFDLPMTRAAGGKQFDASVDVIARWARLLARPDAGFNSKDQEERLQTALLLLAQNRIVNQSRRATGQPPLTLDPAHSRRALRELAEGRWLPSVEDLELDARTVASQLYTRRFGWGAPIFNATEEQEKVIRQWLRENGDTLTVRLALRGCENNLPGTEASGVALAPRVQRPGSRQLPRGQRAGSRQRPEGTRLGALTRPRSPVPRIASHPLEGSCRRAAPVRRARGFEEARRRNGHRLRYGDAGMPQAVRLAYNISAPFLTITLPSTSRVEPGTKPPTPPDAVLSPPAQVLFPVQTETIPAAM